MVSKKTFTSYVENGKWKMEKKNRPPDWPVFFCHAADRKQVFTWGWPCIWNSACTVYICHLDPCHYSPYISLIQIYVSNRYELFFWWEELTNGIKVESSNIGEPREEDIAVTLPTDDKVLDPAVAVLVHHSGQRVQARHGVVAGARQLQASRVGRGRLGLKYKEKNVTNWRQLSFF